MMAPERMIIIMRKNDLTRGSEWPAIFRFSLPLMGASLLQTLYSFVDSVIVGNFVGETAFAAIGLLASSIMLVNMFCSSLGNGVSIVTAQFVGAGKEKDVRETAVTAQILSLAAGMAVVTLCLLGSYPLIGGFLQTPDTMLAYSLQYFRIYSVGLLFQFIYNVCYGLLRAHGDSKGALLFLLTGGILNVALDLLLVIVFHMEVIGAALATIVAQAGSAAACVIYMYRRYPSFDLRKRENRLFHRLKARMISSVSLPILCQTSVLSIGFIVLQRLVNTFGPASIEGFAAEQKVESFIHIIPGALNSAMSSFTGQNVGAGQLERVERGFRKTALAGFLVSAAIAVFMIAFDTRLLSIFHISGEGLARGAAHLDLLVLFMLPQSVYTIAAGLLQGAGDVKITAFSSFLNLFIRVTSAYLMARTPIGFRALWWSLPPAWTANFLINMLRVKSGKWKEKALVRS